MKEFSWQDLENFKKSISEKKITSEEIGNSLCKMILQHDVSLKMLSYYLGWKPFTIESYLLNYLNGSLEAEERLSILEQFARANRLPSFVVANSLAKTGLTPKEYRERFYCLPSELKNASWLVKEVPYYRDMQESKRAKYAKIPDESLDSILVGEIIYHDLKEGYKLSDIVFQYRLCSVLQMEKYLLVWLKTQTGQSECIQTLITDFQLPEFILAQMLSQFPIQERPKIQRVFGCCAAEQDLAAAIGKLEYFRNLRDTFGNAVIQYACEKKIKLTDIAMGYVIYARLCQDAPIEGLLTLYAYKYISSLEAKVISYLQCVETQLGAEIATNLAKMNNLPSFQLARKIAVSNLDEKRIKCIWKASDKEYETAFALVEGLSYYQKLQKNAKASEQEQMKAGGQQVYRRSYAYSSVMKLS